jgi:hypothetical protein
LHDAIAFSTDLAPIGCNKGIFSIADLLLVIFFYVRRVTWPFFLSDGSCVGLCVMRSVLAPPMKLNLLMPANKRLVKPLVGGMFPPTTCIQ